MVTWWFLVSFLLVLAAAVTLVVGLLQSGLTLIYLSIGCSVVAGLVLAVAVLRGRPEPKAAPYAAPPRPVSTPTPTPVPSYSSGSRASRSRPTSPGRSTPRRPLRPGVLRPGDLCLTLGAGDLASLADELLAE